MDQKIRKRRYRPVAGFAAGYFKIRIIKKRWQAITQILYVLIFNDDGIIIKDKPVRQRLIVNRQTDDNQNCDGQQITGGQPGCESMRWVGSAILGRRIRHFSHFRQFEFSAYYGKTFSPPRHKDPKMNMNQRFRLVSGCLCGNLFRLVRVRVLLCAYHEMHDRSTGYIEFGILNPKKVAVEARASVNL